MLIGVSIGIVVAEIARAVPGVEGTWRIAAVRSSEPTPSEGRRGYAKRRSASASGAAWKLAERSPDVSM